MACASVPCQSDSTQSSMPPCHRHHQAPTDKAPLDCSHPLLVADMAAAAVQANPSDFVVDFDWRLMSLVVPAPLLPQALAPAHLLSPPGLSAINSVILRV